jgi:hypothetical protein
MPDQELRVKQAQSIERIAKHPNGWDLMKQLTQRIAGVHEIK